jgi:hypothetical protein
MHNTQWSGPIGVQVQSTDNKIQRMRIKEALAIKKWRPNLNTRDNLFHEHILFE